MKLDLSIFCIQNSCFQPKEMFNMFRMYVSLTIVMRAVMMVAGVVGGGGRKVALFNSGVIKQRRWLKTLR